MPVKAENKALYPSDWPFISWLVRYFRAGGRCEWIDEGGQRCARLDGQTIPGNPRGSKTVLTVAHLNHNPADCRLTNLLALCKLHHLRYDAPHHAKNAARTRHAKQAALYDSLLF